MSDLELQQLFDNTFDCYTYYEDDSMEEVQEPAMTKATFVAEVFKLLRKQANDARTENSKCAIPVVRHSSFTSVDDEMPIAYETGGWDGKRSDLLLLKFDNGNYETGRLYHGFMDGSEFNEWYNDNDLGWLEKVVAWAKIPD